MARTLSADRLDRVADAATRVFIEKGYRRTLMSDVAAEAGVSPGALYNYVEGKDALFHLLFEEEGFAGRTLPVPNPPPGATVDLVRARLAQAGSLPRLRAALRDDHPKDVRSEFE